MKRRKRSLGLAASLIHLCVCERDDDDTEEGVSCYAPLHKRPSPSFFRNRDKTFPQTKTSLEKTCCKLGRTK